jgi:hypothetical protein
VSEEAPDVDDVEALKAERDELRREVDAMHQRKLRRTRGVLSVIGVLLSCVLLLATVAGVWARRSFLRSDIFSERAGNLIDNPEVQAALSLYLSEQITRIVDPEQVLEDVLPDRAQILAVPLSTAVETFIADQVTTFVESDRFADLWKEAVRRAHERAIAVLEGDSDIVHSNGDHIVIDLLPIINGILAAIGEQSPEIFGHTVDLPTITVDDIPEEARQRLGDALGIDLDDDFGTFEVYDDGALSTAQDAVRLADQFVWVLVVLTPLVMAGTIALSARRRRTILQLSIGVAVTMVLLRRLVLLFQEDLLDLVRVESNRPAVEVTSDAFLDPLLTGVRWVAVIALVVAVLALLSGPYAWARSSRAWVATNVRGLATAVSTKAKDEDTASWAAEHLDALRIVGAAVGVALLWWMDLTWGRFFLVVILVGAFELGVAALAARATPDEDVIEEERPDSAQAPSEAS